MNIKSFLFFSLLVFAAKIGYSVVTGFPGGQFEDWNIAKNLAEKGVYAEFYAVGPTAFKLPGYPLFISFFILVFSDFAKEAIVITQHLIFFLLPFLIIRIFKLFNKQEAGILTGYIFIFSPAYFYYSNVIEVTNIFLPVFMLWIYHYLKIYTEEKSSWKALLILGLLSGVLFLTQVIVVPLVVVLLFVLFFRRKLRFAGLILVFAVTSIVYSPWIIRNYVVFDKIILTKSPFWQNIYTGLVPSVNVCDEVKLISREHDEYTYLLKTQIDEFKMEKIYRQEVLRVLKGKEEKLIIKAIQNAALLWYVPARYYHQDLTGNYGRKMIVMLFNLLTVLSLIYCFKHNRRVFAASVLLFVSFTVPYMIGHAANTRFKLDFEWYQYALVSLFIWDSFLRRKLQSSAGL